MKKLTLVLVILITLLFTFPVNTSSALEPGASVYEDFSNPIQYRLPNTPSDYYWWAILDNDFIQYYGSACDPENVNCLTRELENGDYFARFSKGIDPTPLGYNDIEFSELQTGYSYGQGLERWCPSVGHPVIMSEKIRFGNGYNQDGSGGAVGSAGGGLWNSNPDFPNSTVHPGTSIWWSWTEQGTANGYLGGLSVNVLKDDALVFLNKLQGPAYPLNMRDWMDVTILWAKLASGMDHISFVVAQDGHNYNAGTVVAPNLGCLSVTNWNDNSFATFNPDGSFKIDYHNPTQTDSWDLSTISVVQP